MKVLSIDNECIVLFFMDIDYLDDLERLENKFKQIFSKLKDIYSIIIEGYYTINIYTDNIMGMIVVIEKDDIDYFDYLDNQVEMRIIVHENSAILYEIEDNFTTIEYLDIYFYKNKFYGKIKKILSSLEIGYLLEYSLGILYGDLTKHIIKDINYLKQ